MDEIKVTVWCAAYNHEKYIEKALQGFVSQKTTFKYEVLIHDDASTDKTVEIIEKYRSKYPNIIKPIYESTNLYKKGIDYNANICLPNAKGKYIAFCEGDDYWVDSNKLQKQYELMEANSNVSLCVGKTTCTNEDDSYNEIVFPPNRIDKLLSSTQIINKEKFIKLLFMDNFYPFHTSTYFIKREVIDQNSIYTKLYGYINGDVRILLSAATMGDIGYINDVVSNRRISTINSWSNSFVKKTKDEKFEYYCNTIKGLLYYRELQNCKYSDYVTINICNGIMFLINDFEVDKVIDFCKTLDDIDMPNSAKIKDKLKFKMFKNNPNLLKKLYKLKKLISINNYE